MFELKCFPGDIPTGNIKMKIYGANVKSPWDPKKIPVDKCMQK